MSVRIRAQRLGRWEDALNVHYCYRCELRFHAESEVRDHLVRDHGVEPEKVERHYAALPRGVHPHRRPPDPAREHGR